MSTMTIKLDTETYKVLAALASERNLPPGEMAKALFIEHSKTMQGTGAGEETVTVPAGRKALFVEASAYRDLERMADALNGSSWGEKDNTAQSIFDGFIFSLGGGSSGEAKELFQSHVIEGMDYLQDQDPSEVYITEGVDSTPKLNPKFQDLEDKRRSEIEDIAEGIQFEN